MTSAVRFSAGFARVCALKSRLWTPIDRGLLLRGGTDPDGTPLNGDPDTVFPPLIRWHATVATMYPDARPLLAWLLRLLEIENVKLLWRAALRGRPPIAACWRPLQPLATVTFEARVVTPHALVERLARTPYRDIARALFRSHAADLPAAEMGLDRWAWTGLYDEALRLPLREAGARRLIRLLVLEHDLDLLRRGRAFALDADLVAKATVVLSRECGAPALSRAASWTAADGPLWRFLPPRAVALVGEAADWDQAVRALRVRRVHACRRAFIGWPFQLAPAVGALLLREAQARAQMAIAAVRSAGAGASATDALATALAASALEA